MGLVRGTGALVMGALLAPGATHASELVARNATKIGLKVNRKGEALVSYTVGGSRRRALVLGAVNARTPDANIPQVRFRIDFSGGRATYHRLYWRTFRNACHRYDGPELAALVVACKAPDGSYWALQRIQRNLPLLGFDPWLPSQTVVELQISHWTGPLAELVLQTKSSFGGSTQTVFGRMTYAGQPVYGFASSGAGSPRDRYGRNVYVDTLGSAYGPGWRRETGILTHRPTGTFCHAFVPQVPPEGYPDRNPRPPGTGSRYRATVLGPGVTPIVVAETPAAPTSGAEARFDELMSGDPVCRRLR